MKKIFVAFLICLPMVSFANFDSSLKYGSRGDAVIEVQDFLQEEGFYTGKLDGRYGFGTFSAVKKFQDANGLKVDGYFGKASRTKANEILAVILQDSNADEQTETGTISQIVPFQTPAPVVVQPPVQSTQSVSAVQTPSPVVPTVLQDIVITNATVGDVVAGKDCFNLSVKIIDDNGKEISAPFPIYMGNSEFTRQKTLFGGGGDKNMVTYCPSSAGDVVLTFTYPTLGLVKTLIVTSIIPK